ncbi:hypothetical protein SAMN04488028_107103 [Reichenbachiella agariperforans]|uniref:Cytochrome c domain-containing protein n=1 Tax=Reichenbachiella agariperforans TaxID=156994 RepID=A0A1M6UG86_REIAG|nr:c-type cytochrome [Reichenbachiella agariperforans]SHK68078.1 hypothetical protein SAMN04488028_107103 [Reichenbachiella agariperforans]
MKHLILSLSLWILIGLLGCNSKSGHQSVKVPQKSATETLLTMDCLHCHSISDRLVGPPYLDISRRYHSEYGIKPKLMTKIKEGGGGLWYGGVMSGHPLIKDMELSLLVDWILSLEDRRDAFWDRYAQSTSMRQLDEVDSTILSWQSLHEGRPIQTGSAHSIHLLGSESFPSHDRKTTIQFTGQLPIPKTGKYFIRLIKTGKGQIKIGDKILLPLDPKNREAVIDLQKGSQPIAVTHQLTGKNDTLSLSWLPPGADFYELIQW